MRHDVDGALDPRRATRLDLNRHSSLSCVQRLGFDPFLSMGWFQRWIHPSVSTVDEIETETMVVGATHREEHVSWHNRR